MDDQFKIYIEQLRGGHETQLDEKLAPAFMDIREDELSFEKEIDLQGKAYLAEDELIINWDIHTEALLPCSICNEKVSVPIDIENFYYSEPLSSIKSGVYNFKELLRETILLEVPPFAECHQGQCPKRKEIGKYLKPDSIDEDANEGYHPFADLDWK